MAEVVDTVVEEVVGRLGVEDPAVVAAVVVAVRLAVAAAVVVPVKVAQHLLQATWEAQPILAQALVEVMVVDRITLAALEHHTLLVLQHREASGPHILWQ